MQLLPETTNELDILTPPGIDEEFREMMNPVKKNSGTDWRWILTTVLGAIAFGGGIVWAWHSEVSKVYDRLGEIDKHISRVETAVRIIGAKQGGDTKTLIDEALTVAKNAAKAGHTDNAKVIVGFANRLLEEQKKAKAELPPQFFDRSLTHYQAILKYSPELRESVRAGTLTLAEYKSAITAPPPIPEPQLDIGTMIRVGKFTYLKDVVVAGRALINSPYGTDIDYFVLDNVTFQDATIVYRGDPIVLNNVRFINCRFLVPDSEKGDQLLEAAIKQPATAQIG